MHCILHLFTFWLLLVLLIHTRGSLYENMQNSTWTVTRAMRQQLYIKIEIWFNCLTSLLFTRLNYVAWVWSIHVILTWLMWVILMRLTITLSNLFDLELTASTGFNFYSGLWNCMIKSCCLDEKNCVHVTQFNHVELMYTFFSVRK